MLIEMEKFRHAFDALERTIREEDRQEMRAMMRLSTSRRVKFDK